MGYKPVYLDSALLKERLAEMGRLGVKSVMYAGEGEPLLHKDIVGIVAHTTASGIDAAMTSNAVLLEGPKAEAMLRHLTWIKVSLNAGTAETYAAVHRTKPADFGRVLENLAAATRLREELGSRCTLGAQILLLPENEGEVELLARELKRRGVDYLVVKPYSQHLMSDTREYEDVDYARYLALEDRLRDLSGDRFQVIFRARAMKKLGEEKRAYERCLALPFWSYIDSYARLWGCSAYLGNEDFCFGSLAEHTFEELWQGERRKAIMERVARDHDTTACRRGCRMDEVNRYLWELTHPSAHVNFI
jgi:MoaA/NifB/PqqE/SkfB family radical SAM enzyme